MKSCSRPTARTSGSRLSGNLRDAAGISTEIPPRWLRDRCEGFLLVELMVSTLVSAILLGGLLVLLEGVQAAHARSTDLQSAQQSARISMEQIQRDLHRTGIGLAWVLPPFPLIVPRPDGGMEIRHNQGGLATSLTRNMSNTGSAIRVRRPERFRIGETIALYDAGGSLDFVTITGITPSTNTILHDGAAKAFKKRKGAAVSRVQTVSYWVEELDGIPTLMRRTDEQPAQPLARGVEAITIRYFEDFGSLTPFEPETLTEQLRVHAIDVELTVIVGDPSLAGPETPRVRILSRVTPRAVALS